MCNGIYIMSICIIIQSLFLYIKVVTEKEAFITLNKVVTIIVYDIISNH